MQRALLTLLAHHAPAGVPADAIVDQLWPGSTRDEVQDNLYVLVSRTRRLLTDAGMPGSIAKLDSGYQLRVARDGVDLHRFHDCVEDARLALRERKYEQVVASLTEALTWWHEPPLADLHSDWADRRRQRLTHFLLHTAYTVLFDAQLALGDHHAVLAQLPAVMERHKNDEHLAGQWMQALTGVGRTGDVARFYNTFQHGLVHELGTSSSAELDALYRRLTERETPADPLPPSSATITPPYQLPAPPSHLVGRAEQLAVLDRLAAQRTISGGTIVIAGMPGIGKTSLAQHWAWQHADEFPGGQVYVRCFAHGSRPPLDPAEGLAILLDAAGLASDRLPADIERRRHRLTEIVAHRRILIVLDDVADTAHARALTVAAPGCLFLLTSRSQLQPLIVEDGAAQVSVSALDDEASTALLAARLGDGTRRAAMQGAVQAAGGIPLALGILAHHLATRPRLVVAEDLTELRRQLMRPNTDETVAMRATIALSEARLPEIARTALHRLSLHPGLRIDPGATAALIDTSIDTAADALELLARRYLVTPAGDDMYELHDLIREYAQVRVNETHNTGALQAARRRLLDYFLATAIRAAELTSAGEAATVDMQVSIPARNLCSSAEALAWCESERSTLLTLTRYAADHDLHRRAWQLAGTFARLLDRFGHHTDLVAAHSIAVDSAVADDSPEGVAVASADLGAALFRLHHLAQASLCFRHALQTATSSHHHALAAIARHNLAVTVLRLGDAATAIRLFKTVLGNARIHGDQYSEASALHRLGQAHRLAHDGQQAALYLRAALDLHRNLDARREQAATLTELARLHLDQHNPYPALALSSQALDLETEVSDRIAETETLIVIARIRQELGQPHGALRPARRALDLASRQADSHQRAQALVVLADVLAASGHRQEGQYARRQARFVRQDLEASTPPLSLLPRALRPQRPSQAS